MSQPWNATSLGMRSLAKSRSICVAVAYGTCRRTAIARDNAVPQMAMRKAGGLNPLRLDDPN